MRKIKRRKKEYPIYEKPKFGKMNGKKTDGFQKIWISEHIYLKIAIDSKAKGMYIAIINIKDRNQLVIRPVSFNATYIRFEKGEEPYWKYKEESDDHPASNT